MRLLRLMRLLRVAKLSKVLEAVSSELLQFATESGVLLIKLAGMQVLFAVFI